MAKVAVLLLLCLAFVQTVLTLKCYSCSDNCMEVSDKNVLECGINAGDQNKRACLKKVITDVKTNKQNVTRSCIIVNDKDNACKSTLPNTKVDFCESCTDNLCNSSPANYGVISIASGVVSFFTLRYFLN